jgi:hypothetical protein
MFSHNQQTRLVCRRSSQVEALQESGLRVFISVWSSGENDTKILIGSDVDVVDWDRR